MDQPFERIAQYSSYKDKVYKQVKDRILNHQLKSGENLVERTIAGKLGVSRTPVREAFKLLEAEGWLEITPWKGVVVRPVSLKEAKDVVQLRIAVECFAVEQITLVITEDEVARLDEILKESEELIVSGADAPQVAEHDRLFHMGLVNALGNAQFEHLLENLNDKMIRLAVWAFNAEGRIHLNHREHRDILEAVRSRKSGDAAVATRKHLDNTLEAIERAAQDSRELLL